jgi:hypothetical protein
MAGNWLNCRSHAAGRAISFGGVQFAARLTRRAPHFHCGRRQVETLIEPRMLGRNIRARYGAALGSLPERAAGSGLGVDIATFTGGEMAAVSIPCTSLVRVTPPWVHLVRVCGLPIRACSNVHRAPTAPARLASLHRWRTGNGARYSCSACQVSPCRSIMARRWGEGGTAREYESNR